VWVIFCPLVFALGVNFFPAFQYHYMAAVTCLFVLIGITGLQQLSRFNALAARVDFVLCIAQFRLEYGLHSVQHRPMVAGTAKSGAARFRR
jgi:hypothetical protein